jgi:hypothetical protein
MKKSAYGKPILISDGNAHLIERIEQVDELTIQNLVFDYPECLPISDIDEAYNPLIQVCKELNTKVGAIDILSITPNGDIVIIETKLWRNPEARRKVIGQILDYATELSKWNYEDLQREINRKLNQKGNTLYRLVKQSDSPYWLSEADFVDAVNRNLSRGKFLLLIIGDGIREGAANIADFLNTAGHLNFTLGMIELTLYKLNNNESIVLPRTIVKTVEIQRVNIELPEGLVITNDNSESSIGGDKNEDVTPELKKQREFFKTFWEEFIAELDLDDPGQPLPNPTKTQNLYIYPGKNKYAWISAYFAQSYKRVGVYFRFNNTQPGWRIMEELSEYKEDIKNELGDEVIWTWDTDPTDIFGVRLPMEDVYSNSNREEIKEFFKYWVNQFVNVLRPRLKEGD